MPPSYWSARPPPRGLIAGRAHSILWAITAELAGVAYASPDPDQLSTTVGLQWSARDDLDISITGLRGWLPGGDQYGVLVGVTPRFRLW